MSSGLMRIRNGVSLLRDMLSVTRTPKSYVPATVPPSGGVGFPAISPAAVSDRPFGNRPLARLNDSGGVPPVALSVVVGYATPDAPSGKSGFVILGVAPVAS